MKGSSGHILFIFLILISGVTAAGATADSGFSVELDNSVDVPPQSVQGVTADQFAVVKPGSQITGQATGPVGVDYFIGFARPDGSREIIGNTRTGGTTISISTDDAEVGTHVVAVATGASRDDVEAAQPVVIEAYDVTTSSADGFETTTESQLNVSATLSKHDGVTSPIDDVEAVVWNETYQKRVSMTQDGTLEYETAISDLPAGEFSLSVIVRSENTNDLIDRNDAIGVSDPKAVNVNSASNFSVDIARSPANVTAGDSFDVRANISNTGTTEGTKDVTLSFAGRTADVERDVTLPPGSSQEVTLTGDTTENDTGEQTVEIQAGSGTDSRVINVETAPPSPANFQVTVAEANSTARITPNETATIVADVENTGDETDTQEIDFELEGRILHTENVTLGDGDIQTIDFAYNTSNNPVEISDQLNFTVVSENNSDTFTTTIVEEAFFDPTITNPPTEVTENDEITVNYEIKNTGGVSDTQTITLTINGTEQRTTRLTVANDSTATNSFSYITSNEDVPRIELGIETEDTTATTPIIVNKDAFFDVTITDVPRTVTEGDEVTVGYSVTNTGGVRDTQDISFTINGSTRDTAGDIALSPGDTTDGSFKYVTDTDDLPSITTSVTSDNDFATERVQVAEVGVLNVSIDEAASSLSVRDTETIIVSANVTNTGDVPLEQDITANVAGTTQATNSSLKIPGGETETLKFEFEARSDFDGQAVNVSSANTSDAATLNVDTVGELAVSINDGASTTDVTAGEDAVINATIENTGDETATQTINFTVNGSDEGSVEVTNLAGGTTETVEFTYTTEAADDGATAAVASDDDSANRTLTVTEPASFAVAINDGASTTDVTAGENAVINATVENTGDETATQTINFTVNGSDEGSVSVNLNGGATETVAFTYTTELADDGATAAVASGDDNATRTLTVTEPADPANFAVAINDGASTTDVTAGEDAVINATIQNTGDETATQTINFTVNDTPEDNISVNLAGGATETVEFTYTTEAADDGATATVASDDDSANRTLTVTEPASFAVAINDGASTTDVTAGEDAVINATIQNTGDETATQTINFTVNDTPEDNISVNLAGGATETVEFTYTTEAADDGATATVASDDDSANRTLTVTEPASFAVAINDGASTTDVTAGEDAVINATIQNTGDETATQTIDFTVNDTAEDNVSVNLAGGATETVEFSYTTEAADDGATAAVASDDASDSTQLTVTEPANFAVSINDGASETDVTAGENAVINATVENTGDETATQTINFSVNDTTEQSVDVTDLAGGSTEVVEFSYTTEAADDGATAEVASDDDTATRTLTVTEPADSANFAVAINDGASTTDVTAGEDAVINATVENTGDETATQTINFTVNGSDEGSVEVTNLNGGATETVEFTYATELADDGATAEIASDDASDSTQLTVTEPADPANFAVSDLQPQDTTVTAGENFTVSATITNTGDQTGTQEIQLLTEPANGDELANETVALDAGANTTVTFENVSVETVSEFNHTVASENDSATGSLTVNERPDPATFTVSINDGASTTDVTAGENAVINATIENTGDEAATQTINFTVGGSNEGSVEVTNLAGGTTETVEFTYTAEAADDGATAEVASDDDNATRTLTVTEPADPANFAVTINDGASTTDVTAGENAVINATVENTGDETATQTVNFSVNETVENSTEVNLAGGATETVEFTYTTEAADDGATAEVASDDDTATTTLSVGDATQPDPEPQGSVTFNNQTVPNGTETVTVASANYTLADGTPGDYVVVAHVVGDEFEGGLSAPVGYSSNLTGEAADITVDLNASEAQGDALDTLTANTTLRAMLHETNSDSAFGPSLGLATDDATITVEADAQPDPANFTVSDLQPQDVTVTAGETFTVSATITNTGDQAGEQDIQLLTEPTDGDVLATETNVSLDAGNSTTVTFENVSVETVGEFNHTVASNDDTATGSLTVEPQPDPGTANLTSLDIAGQGDTARLTPGAERNVTVTLANTGGEQGTFAVALNITANGTTADTATQEVSLASGANTTVTFENVTGDLAADEYNLTVTAAESAVTGNLTVKPAPAAIGGDENATAQDLDNDGTFEDVNGDGNLTVEDVFELFNNQDAVPEDDTAAFDFNNDGDFNLLDVQRLLNQQQEGS